MYPEIYKLVHDFLLFLLKALLDTTAPNIAGCPGNITVTSFTSNYEQVTWQVPTATDASPPVTRTETHFPGVFISRGQTINVIYHFTDAFTNTAVCSFFIVAPGKKSNISLQYSSVFTFLCLLHKARDTIEYSTQAFQGSNESRNVINVNQQRLTICIGITVTTHKVNHVVT